MSYSEESSSKGEEPPPSPTLPLKAFAGWFVSIFLLLGATFAFSVAASIRFEDPCAAGGDLHCSIPECHCGTPNQRSGCREQPRPGTAICYPDEFRVYQKDGGDAFSWVLCAIAGAVLIGTAVAFLFLRRHVLRLRCIHRLSDDIDGLVADDMRTLLGRVMVVLGGLYVALVTCFALSIFAGAVLARKKMDDFIRLSGVAQALLYVGIAFLLISLGILTFIFKGRQWQ